jgi:type IV/VI secretion system ImpK/VasF family protein
MAATMIQCSRELDKALGEFENLALRLTGSKGMAIHGSFLLCTLTDELLIEQFDLSWTKLSLLAKHHANAHGGETSWHTLEQLLLSKGRRSTHELDMLQLYEICIALGFRGRYRAMVDGENTLYQLRVRLHKAIYGKEHNEAYLQQLAQLAMRSVEGRQLWSRFKSIGLIALVSLIIVVLVELTLAARWNEVANTTLPNYVQTD